MAPTTNNVSFVVIPIDIPRYFYYKWILNLLKYIIINYKSPLSVDLYIKITLVKKNRDRNVYQKRQHETKKSHCHGINKYKWCRLSEHFSIYNNRIMIQFNSFSPSTK